VRDGAPALKFGGRRVLDAELPQHFAVESLGVIGERHLVDRGHVARLDHGGSPHVAEQGELAALVFGIARSVRHEQDVGLDADRAKLSDRVLRRLGLQLPAEGM
jgi:hypothetical protein